MTCKKLKLYSLGGLIIFLVFNYMIGVSKGVFIFNTLVLIIFLFINYKTYCNKE